MSRRHMVTSVGMNVAPYLKGGHRKISGGGEVRQTLQGKNLEKRIVGEV